MATWTRRRRRRSCCADRLRRDHARPSGARAPLDLSRDGPLPGHGLAPAAPGTCRGAGDPARAPGGAACVLRRAHGRADRPQAPRVVLPGAARRAGFRTAVNRVESAAAQLALTRIFLQCPAEPRGDAAPPPGDVRPPWAA